MAIVNFVKSLADGYRYGIDCIIDNNDLLALALSKMPNECIEPMESCNDATNTNTVTTITCDGGTITLDSEVVNTVNTITQINVFGKGSINDVELKTNKTFRANVIGKGIIIKPDLDRTSGQTTVTDIDGNTYNFVTIGDYDWFTTNLKTTRLNENSNGRTIVLHNTPTVDPYTANEAVPLYTWSYIGKYEVPYLSWYANEPSNKNIRGGLYSKISAISKDICPIGWRVPTYDELKNMIDNNNGRIRSTTLWSVIPNVPNPNGFNLIPTGYKLGINGSPLRKHNAKYFDLDTVASLWTNTNGVAQVIQLDNTNIIPVRPNIDEPVSIPRETKNFDIYEGRGNFNTANPPYFIADYEPYGNCIRCMRNKL